MTSSLQACSEGPFYGRFSCYICYIFANCSETSASTSNLSISLESQWNKDSKDILSIRKYCQHFTHNSNTFPDDQYVIPPIQTNGAQMPKKSQKQPLPLEARGPPSNTSMAGPTMPNDSWIGSRTSTQLRNKAPIGYNGMPQIHPKNCPFPFNDHHQNLIHPYQARPHSPP